MNKKTYDVLIIGGGINGLCTAFHLHNRGIKNIALIECHHIGHNMGSSHGHSRITRSAYADPLYVQMMQYSHRIAWPTLEKELHQQLLYPCAGLFYGPQDGLFQKYAHAIEQSPAHVSRLTPKQAQKTFPQFHFHSTDGILQDHTSAVIAAGKTISSLAEYCRSHLDVFENSPLVEFDNTGTTLQFHCKDQTFHAEKAIFCAGPWSGKLLPMLESTLQIVHQNVYYLDLKSPPKGNIDQFPVWVELGMNIDENYYGLPEFGRSGIKVAKHHLTGKDNPDTVIEPSAIQQQAFVQRFKTRIKLN